MLNRMPWESAGVTLIELMITIALVGILLMLAMPSFNQLLLNAQIRTATESILNGLQLARNEAVRCNVPVQFVLGTGTSWTVSFAYPNLPTTCKDAVPDALWPQIQARLSAEGSPQALVAATNPADARTVAFDGAGRRESTNADASAVLTQLCIDLPTSVLAASKTRDLEIDIEMGGGIRMCDPKVTSASDTRFCPDRAGSVCTPL